VTDTQPAIHPASHVGVANTRYAYRRIAPKTVTSVLKKSRMLCWKVQCWEDGEMQRRTVGDGGVMPAASIHARTLTLTLTHTSMHVPCRLQCLGWVDVRHRIASLCVCVCVCLCLSVWMYVCWACLLSVLNHAAHGARRAGNALINHCHTTLCVVRRVTLSACRRHWLLHHTHTQGRI